jgi:carboxyl-terminal processing protease
MEEIRRPRLRIWTPLAAAMILSGGMILGFKLHDTLRNKRDISNVVERNDRLEQIIDLINSNYVDSVATNDLYGDAVKGILSHLDPHTLYIPADDVAAANEELAGSFFGIGVEFAIIRDTIEITSVVQGGPSDKSGIQPGDKLIAVGDTLIAGNGITSERIITMLRGQQRSAVTLQIQSLDRPGVRKIRITRDAVPIVSVDAAILLDPHTAYIKINRFSATTYDEFAEALRSVMKRGATSLILDLRDNPGGYLEAATSIADEFLDEEKLIVYTEGRHEPRQNYTALNDGMFEKGRLAILVDESSASAAEILAGAVQDWDRGIIIGRRSFGKGLVQEQYELEDGAALRLTIARYYTPSGRSIQRSFDKGREAYAEDFDARFASGELTGNDSLGHEDTASFYTLRLHRLVHGGGGIKPDVYVPYDSGRLSGSLINMIISDPLQDAIWDYYGKNVTALKGFKNIATFGSNFKGETEVLNSYLSRLQPAERMNADYLLKRPANRQYLQLQIRSQIGRILFRNNGYYAVSSRGDDMVIRALQLINAPAYEQMIRKQ